MEFRYQHAPLITSLGTGILSLRKADGRNLHFFISSGYAEIHENQLIILADVAENGEDIDYDRAMKAKNRAMKRILDQETGKWDIDRVKAATERAESRINTVKRTGKGSLYKS